MTGKTLAENLADAPGLRPGQNVLKRIEDPMKESGHIRILKGNLSPEGAVAKITGKEGLSFTGEAKVYNSEYDANDGIRNGEVKKGMVVVIHYVMKKPTGNHRGAGRDREDTGSHISPEAPKCLLKMAIELPLMR